MRHLLMKTEPYDVLHYAGHCLYDEADTSASGWVLSRGERLRGVSNFVCTAWPVDDFAARQFALTLYGGLLGLRRQEDRYVEGPMLPMHAAMMAARRAIATTSAGTRTWGAYQHYGSPFLRLFEPSAFREPAPTPPPRAKKKASTARRKRPARRLFKRLVTPLLCARLSAPFLMQT